MRTPLVAAFAAALVFVTAPQPARACTPAQAFPYELDPAFAADTTPPDVQLSSEPVVARRADTATGAGCSSPACGGGSTLIAVSLIRTDDRAPPNRIGVELTLRSGTPPPGLRLPSGPVTGVLLPFDEDAGSFEFELEIRAVDLNGNRSAPIVVLVRDDVEGEGGCAAGPTGPRALTTVLVALALLVALRRRRPARAAMR